MLVDRGFPLCDEKDLRMCPRNSGFSARRCSNVCPERIIKCAIPKP